MYSISARRKDPCATNIIFVRHSSLIKRTTRSANAFRFGDTGGNRITSVPPSVMKSWNRFEYFLPASAPSSESSKLRPTCSIHASSVGSLLRRRELPDPRC